MKNIVEYFTKKTRTLFLIDCLGAALTTFYLFFVLTRFYDYFGMPTLILNYLSLIGLMFCVYSAACYFLLKGNWSPFLRLVGIGNLLYCLLTMVLVFKYYNNLTKLGLVYFAVEIVVIFVLVYIELGVSSALNNQRACKRA